jgi:hypothetical protein
MPLTCPPPPLSPAQPQQEDCGLYVQRLAFDPAEPLRRAVLTERRKRPDLAALIRAESRPASTSPSCLAPGSRAEAPANPRPHQH